MTMGVSVFLYLMFLKEGFYLLFCTYASLSFAAISVTFFEYYTPYKKEWSGNGKDIKNDMLFMVLIQLLFTKFLVFLTALLLQKTIIHLHLEIQGLWPHYLPVLVQGILMVIIIDFFRYWLHRASHNISYLWSLHAVHHSPKKLYWLNVGRFHPIERSLQFLIDSFPFMLLGVSPEVLAMYFLLFAVNGFFQHCNINLKYGLLNYIVSSAELHRWHHSKKIEESNANYSNTTIVWDILFGTWFLPKGRQVGELGLINAEYPLDFSSQMKTPFISGIDKKRIPFLSFKEISINAFLSIRMMLLGIFIYQPFKRAAKNPMVYQRKLLVDIITKNRNTTFARDYQFSKIKDYKDYIFHVPVQTYETLKSYIDEQENSKTTCLNSEFPVMYNQTSGTTGTPKYIPVLKSTLKDIKRNQNLFSYVQYKTIQEGFYGKLLGLVSPAVEGYLSTGTPYGSASGSIYKNMPKIAQSKYVLPYEIFEISDYTIKYYIIMRFALAEKNITYLGSANPSTFSRMLEIILGHKDDLIGDIKNGTIKYIKDIDPGLAEKLLKKVKPANARADELSALINNKEHNLSFTDFWPYLKIITTWTGGSCGISLNRLRNKMPKDTTIFELGYLSTEVRGTITIDGETNAGVLTFQTNFFEFVEKEKWENGKPEFLTLDQIKNGSEYYIFVTTKAGLYRYHMNDIIQVTGTFENTPTIQFIQKGKGVVNLTGEKLYESQLLYTLSLVEKKFSFNPVFYQILGNEDSIQYELYMEIDSDDLLSNKNDMADFIDESLSDLNIEYKTKRQSERLKPIQLHLLKKGTYETYKAFCLSKGQKEGQFKTVILLLKKDFLFDLAEHIIS